MRTMVIIFSMIGLLTLSSCKQDTNVEALLQNSETRSEVIKTITEDQEFMAEFIGNMRNNTTAMQMMLGNKNMMGMMMEDNSMMGNMMKESRLGWKKGGKWRRRKKERGEGGRRRRGGGMG